MLNHSCSATLQDTSGQHEVQAEVQVEVQALERLRTTSARPVNALQDTLQPEKQILSGFR